MWDSGFSSLLITSSSEQIKHQFLIHLILFFQQVLLLLSSLLGQGFYNEIVTYLIEKKKKIQKLK